jgi:TolB-like protein
MINAATLTFDDFAVDCAAAELRQNNQVVVVEPQVFDLIRFFAENPGRLISRDDLIEGVWNGRIVSDAAISTRINAARNALGDDGKAQRMIKTIPRRGFRFLPDVGEDIGSETPLSSAVECSNVPLLVPEAPSIAIMPFDNIGRDSESGVLADGLRIDIQNALIKVSGLFVIAIGSANAVASLKEDAAARKLGVRYLLQGQIQRVGNKVRFSTQLVEATNSHIIWSEQYDREVADSFVFLDEITARVLTAANVTLVVGETARVWHKTLEDLKSLEVFYRGISNFFKMNQAGLASARLDFEKTAKWHPELSLGPTWISLTHWYDLQRGWSDSPETSKKLAREWAEKAIELPDADGQASTVLSHVCLLDRNFDAALSAGRAAVRNRPSCAHANGFYANVLHHCGDQIAAESHIRLAIRHAPIHPPLFKLILAAVLNTKGELEDAANATNEAIRSNSEDSAGHVLMAIIAIQMGNSELARHHVDEVEQHHKDFKVRAHLARQPYRDGDFLAILQRYMIAAGFEA